LIVSLHSIAVQVHGAQAVHRVAIAGLGRLEGTN
jgi:tetrahydromethanopterin S-methyltransferase subunit C